MIASLYVTKAVSTECSFPKVKRSNGHKVECPKTSEGAVIYPSLFVKTMYTVEL